MVEPVSVVVFGLGPIGRAIASVALGKESLRLVGAVDVAPSLVGRPLDEVVPGAPSGACVSGSLADLPDGARPQVVLHATGSRLSQVFPQFEQLISGGCNVVSTCEEASFPVTDEQASLTGTLDSLCKQHGVRLLATGINPGFAMDVWPLVATAAQTRVDRIYVHRVVDASTRREPLQRKVGAGMTAEQFRQEVDAGRLGHVGLQASALMLAQGLGRSVRECAGTIEPVLATEEVETQYFRVAPGRVVGLRQDLTCRLDGDVELRLYLEMYLGAPDSVDEVEIEGDHPTRVTVAGGFPGDRATAAMIANAVLPSLRCAPGYLRMVDLPFFGCAS